ncbi:MAG: nucleoside-diphosphate kinase [Bacteroidales bacterium]
MEQTFAIIKPRAYEENLAGAILNMITSAGFRISGIKALKLNREQAENLYGIHNGKAFYSKLIEFITSGPVIVMALEKENAIEDFRNLIGTTNPEKAEAGTVRRLFGLDKTKNAIHAADSSENAQKEINLFFSTNELV